MDKRKSCIRYIVSHISSVNMYFCEFYNIVCTYVNVCKVNEDLRRWKRWSYQKLFIYTCVVAFSEHGVTEWLICYHLLTTVALFLQSLVLRLLTIHVFRDQWIMFVMFSNERKLLVHPQCNLSVSPNKMSPSSRNAMSYEEIVFEPYYT